MTWTKEEIGGKPADLYYPAAATNPRFAVIFLHGIGLETLGDLPCSPIGWKSCSSPVFVHTDSDVGGVTESALNLTLDSRPSDICSIRWFLLSTTVGSSPPVPLPC